MGGYGPSGRPRRYAPRAPPVPGHVPGPIRSNNFYPELPQRRQYRNNQQSREEGQTVHRQGSVPDYCLSHRQPQHQQSREEGQPPINYNHIRGYGPMTRRPTAPPPNLRRLLQEKFDPTGLPTTLGVFLLICFLSYLYFKRSPIPRKSVYKVYIVKKPTTFVQGKNKMS